MTKGQLVEGTVALLSSACRISEVTLCTISTFVPAKSVELSNSGCRIIEVKTVQKNKKIPSVAKLSNFRGCRIIEGRIIEGRLYMHILRSLGPSKY